MKEEIYPQETNGKVIPQISIDALTLYNRIKTMKIGDVIEYKELNALIGRDCQKTRGPLTTARRRAERLDNIVIECVHNEGIKRIDDIELVAVGESGIRHIHRKANKIFTKLGKTDNFEAMPQDKKQRLIALRTLAAFSKDVTKEKRIKVIENSVKTTNELLPVGKTLELFK